MLFRGLKTNIAINLAILLFIGMMLIDFVMMSSFQKEMIAFEFSKADIFAASIENNLQNLLRPKRTPVDLNTKKHLEELLGKTNYSCLLIKQNKINDFYVTGSGLPNNRPMCR